jgi:hypothetical protein
MLLSFIAATIPNKNTGSGGSKLTEGWCFSGYHHGYVERVSYLIRRQILHRL